MGTCASVAPASQSRARCEPAAATSGGGASADTPRVCSETYVLWGCWCQYLWCSNTNACSTSSRPFPPRPVQSWCRCPIFQLVAKGDEDDHRGTGDEHQT